MARSALESAAIDHSNDPTAFEVDLMNIARTTLSSKLLNVEKGERTPSSTVVFHPSVVDIFVIDHFARLAVDAVLRLKGSGNLDYIQVCYCILFRVLVSNERCVLGHQETRWNAL